MLLSATPRHETGAAVVGAGATEDDVDVDAATVVVAVVAVDAEDEAGGREGVEPPPHDGSLGKTHPPPQHTVPSAHVIGEVNGALFKQTTYWLALVQAMALSTTPLHVLHAGDDGKTHELPQQTVPLGHA
jgi:hypothetical protein